jgi:hypothetical protein
MCYEKKMNKEKKMKKKDQMEKKINVASICGTSHKPG